MRLLILCITLCSLQLWLATDAHGQLFKFLKKKDKQQAVGFVLEEGMTPEEREKAIKRQLVNPVREMLNRFNLQVEKSFGFFNYQNTLEGVTVVRSSNLENLYAVPLGNESLTLPEPQGIDNWTTDLNATTFPRIDDDSHLVGTDTAALIYRNPGSINPLTLRLSFSLKKLDKEHFKTTGDKRYLDEDLLRKIALDTGGRYFRVTDIASLGKVYRDIDNMEKILLEEDAYDEYNELFGRFLLAGILILLFEIILSGLFLRRIP